MTKNILKILFLEDVSTDYELAVQMLLKAGLSIKPKLVSNEQDFRFQIKTFLPDLIISDYSLPQTTGMIALKIASELAPEIPFIILTGSMNEEVAVECMKYGAVDYIIKEHTSRLPFAVKEAIKKQKIRLENQKILEALKVSEERFRRLAENAKDIIFRIEILPKRKFSYVSRSIITILGYDPIECYSDPDFASRMLYDKSESSIIEQIYTGKINFKEPLLLKMKTKKGDLVWIELKMLPIYNQSGTLAALEGIAVDITEKKKAEDNLTNMNRVYAFISQINKMIMRTSSREKLFEAVCHIAIEYGKFEMAWVGLVDTSSKLIKPFASEGNENGYLSTIRNISIEDIPEGRGPTGTCVRLGKHIVCNDIENDPIMLPWRAEALKRNYKASIALPINLWGEVVGAYTLYMSQANYFNDEEVELLDQVAGDISFALETIVSEEKRRLAEEALRQSENRLKEAEKLALLGHWELDHKEKSIICSDEIKRIFELSINETKLSANTMYSIIHPEDWHEVNTAFLKSLKEKTSFSLDHRILLSGGRIKYVHQEGITDFDKKGRALRTRGTAQDITQRKEFEDVLLNERSLLRTILDLLPDAVYVKDLQGRKIVANKKEIKFCGKESEEEVLGKTDFDLYPESEANVFFSDDQKVLRDGISLLNVEGKLLDKEGNIHWLLGAKVPLRDVHGNITGLVGMNHDFTERKQFEDELLKLSRTVEQSPALVVVTSPEGNIEYVNAKFVEVTGYSREEVNGKNPKILKSGFHDQNFYAQLWERVLSGKEWTGEFLNKKKNGNLYWESAKISPVINKEGDITHFVAVKEDITEKKKMIEELIIAKEKAEEMNRLKSNFLANMSHELRTPLNGILGYSDLLSTTIIDAEELEMIKGINHSAKRLSETLNFILDLSEAETGKMSVNLKEISIVPLILELIDSFSILAEQRRLKISSTIKKQVVIAKLDEHLFKRIIYNLLDNAIKFTKEGGIQVEVGIEDDKLKANGQKLFIKIIDSGIGIPTDKIEVIFEEFRQASEGISRNYEGTGLGLTIAKKAAELMEGTIHVESKVGVGSTFIVEFPLLSAADELTEKTSFIDAKIIDAKPEDTTAAKPLILCVEDDYLNRNMISMFLKNICNVDTAEDGETAVKMASQKKYEAFLVDINLGEGINGMETVQQILKDSRYKSTPMIAVTAYATVKEKEEFLSRGCTHYLLKPFRRNEIVALVSSVLKLSK